MRIHDSAQWGGYLLHSKGSIDGQRDRYDEANSRSSQFFESA